MYALYIADKSCSAWSLHPSVLLRELELSFEERLRPFVSNGAQSDAPSSSRGRALRRGGGALTREEPAA